MACPSLEKHFEWLDQTIGDIDDLKRYGDQENPERRYCFLDSYAEKLRYTIKGAILRTLGKVVVETEEGEKEVPETVDWTENLRTLLYESGSKVINFYKILNVIRFADPREVVDAANYACGHLDDNWGPEHDEVRIFPRYYVEKIVRGEEVPLWVFKLSRNLDVSYLSGRDKMRFLNRMIRCSDLEARVAEMTHFNIGAFDYDSTSLLDLIDLAENEYSLDKLEGEDAHSNDVYSVMTYFGALRDIVGSMRNLRHLNLSKVMCRGRILEVVEACPNKANIETLDLSWCGLTATEFRRLDTIGLESLEDFRARKLRHSIQFVPDSHGYLTRLRRLDLSDNDILTGDVFLELLGNSAEMEELLLVGSIIGGVESFKLNMSSLRLLDMTEALMFDGNDEDFIDLPELEDLRVDGMRGLRENQTWEVPRLKHLRCTGNEDLGIVAANLTRYFPQLVSLHLEANIGNVEEGSGNFFMSGVPLDDLSPVNLRYLSLPGAVDFGNRDYFRNSWFGSVGTFVRLEAFGFGNDTNLLFEAEEGESPLVFGLPVLTELDCRWTGGLPTCIDQKVGVSNMNLEYFGLSLPDVGIYPFPVPDSLRVFKCRDLRTAESTCVFLDNEDRTSFASDNFMSALCGSHSRVQGYSTRVAIPAGIIERLEKANPRLQYFSCRLTADGDGGLAELLEVPPIEFPDGAVLGTVGTILD